MGTTATPEFLIARWDELCRDPSLANLPYKIELNAWGKVEMGPPAGVGHGRQKCELASQLREQLPGGVVIVECPVLTAIGVRVPDVVWISDAFRKQHKRSSPLPRAREICIEIFSPSNGSVRYIDRSGEKPRSRFPVSPNLPDVTHDYL